VDEKDSAKQLTMTSLTLHICYWSPKVRHWCWTFTRFQLSDRFQNWSITNQTLQIL